MIKFENLETLSLKFQIKLIKMYYLYITSSIVTTLSLKYVNNHKDSLYKWQF